MKWLKDDQTLVSDKDSRITLDFDARQGLHILTIKDSVRTDEGAYKLKVYNEEGSVSVTVVVTAKKSLEMKEEEHLKERPREDLKDEPCEPKIEVAPEPVTFQEGETIKLACKISGQLTDYQLRMQGLYHDMDLDFRLIFLLFFSCYFRLLLCWCLNAEALAFK